ncbi:hypothetical protein MHBO_001343 [Bonamia ostreae]|uniref:Uncharacterized protein n=1 Tax=Bonamia ostreae TaxID=126728 RepID=A0ABV2AIP2_9EUKA
MWLLTLLFTLQMVRSCVKPLDFEYKQIDENTIETSYLCEKGTLYTPDRVSFTNPFYMICENNTYVLELDRKTGYAQISCEEELSGKIVSIFLAIGIALFFFCCIFMIVICPSRENSKMYIY